MGLFLLPLVLLASGKTSTAAEPPMGWNSYDCFGYGVTEKEVLAEAEFMAQHLKSSGWNYVVIDYIWYGGLRGPDYNWNSSGTPSPISIDKYGRPQPDPIRFPSSADGAGFRKLADKLHSMGLKFGIHLMRGIPRQAAAENDKVYGTNTEASEISTGKDRCTWLNLMDSLDMSNPASQAYLNSLFDQYADWGVDFVKVDDISNPYRAAAIVGYRKAIDQCGRQIVLSLSPGETPPSDAKDVASKANMWRTLPDLWDTWKQEDHAFDIAAQWSQYRGPGHWPDLDMLPLGKLRLYGPQTGPANSSSRLTPTEQQTMLTLWCITKSPLMFGGDLTQSPQSVLDLIENPEAMAVDQTGITPVQVRGGDYPVWMSRAKAGEYFALFNRTDKARKIDVIFDSNGTKVKVRDLWTRADLGEYSGTFSFEIPAHGSFLGLASRSK